jgi:hypothetical protein
MKLVVIMSLDTYAGDLEKIYAEHRVPVFSEADIRGFRLDNPVLGGRDWFSRPHTPLYSTLTFAFVEAEKAHELLDAIEETNRTVATESPIRAFQLDVERSI